MTMRINGRVSGLVVAAVVVLALVAGAFPAGATHFDAKARAEFVKALEEAKKIEGNKLIGYDHQPNYANWGGVQKFFTEKYGLIWPPDMKSSVTAMAALIAEQANPQASVVYYNAAIGSQAAERGLHEPYKPKGWELIPPEHKDPDGKWFNIHYGTIAFVINMKALERTKVPVPKCWSDLVKPEYKNLVAYDDPTVQGTAFDAIFTALWVHGGTYDNLRPGIEYLKKLHPNIISYNKETSYNPSLRGEIPIWLHADGSGYKMKHHDRGPVEVVIPCEGTTVFPLNMALVKGAPTPRLAKLTLDWLNTEEAQRVFAESFFRPIHPGALTPEIEAKMKPLHGSYDNIKPYDLRRKVKMVDEYKKAWVEEVRRAR
ncbi:MAG: extracellular solute-binding protein [Candidatus Rokubacteria bacterium]|nr:extracellular solute-binding protein [Candidatus Rokubacteria bacterium]